MKHTMCPEEVVGEHKQPSSENQELQELQSRLDKTRWTLDQQLQMLLETVNKSATFFEAIWTWGKLDLRTTFKILVHLFGEEKLRVRKDDVGIDNALLPGQRSKYCRIAKKFLEYSPKVMRKKYYESKGNIMHAVCEEGVGSIAETVVEALEERRPGSTLELLMEPNEKNWRPTKLAVNNKDTALVKLVAFYDDGKRRDYVLDVVKNGNLPFLEVLLEAREDQNELLHETIFDAAAESGDMSVWLFLVQQKPEQPRNPQHLKKAVASRRLNIVQHILDHNKEVLHAQDKLQEIAAIAVVQAKLTPSINAGDSAAKMELIRDLQVSKMIEDVILDKMIRELDPSVVKACWPQEPGRAAKEVSLELALRNPRDWTWFAQLVKTAEFEVMDWQKSVEDEAKRLKEEEKQAADAEKKRKQDEERRAIEEREKMAKYMRMLEEVARSLSVEDSRTETSEIMTGILETTRKRVEEVGRMIDGESRGLTFGSETSSQMDGEETGTLDGDEPKIEMQTHIGASRVFHTPSYRSRYNVDFQPHLKSVSIPDLDQFRANSCATQISHLFGSEVKLILHWLRNVKGVRKILKLRVLDSRHHAHSEEMIEESIRDLEVEELDWRRLDVSTRTIAVAAEKAHTLHLYSSGSWMPICHWVGTGGLDVLKNVRYLIVTIIKDQESGISLERVTSQDEELRTWLGLNGWKPDGDPTLCREQEKVFSLKVSPWVIAGPPVAGTKDVAVVRDPRTVIRLSKFISWYQRVHKKRSTNRNPKKHPRRVKIAVLDSGVNLGEFEEASDLMGDCFSEGGDTHWWLSSERHGTQMAKIIKAVDPCCQLFIAKVADHRNAITVGAVVQALKRVTAMDIDVVSMSFALDDTNDELRYAITVAKAKGIVLLCSTADEGENRTKAWPASYSDTLAIAACNDQGEKSAASTTEAEYYFRGENVLYEQSRGNDNGTAEKISGSSVATAIAAGVASLCLACCQLDGVTVNPLDRSKKVEDLFNLAKAVDADAKSKYVKPWALFGEMARGDGDPMFLSTGT